MRQLLALLIALVLVPAAAAQPDPTYVEPFRPQFHFTPPVNWMNDPNGLVYYDGEYHLFYQYNPFGNTWGHMSWGHAVSSDLVHWEHLPVAIPEQDGIMAFSGSAVIDWDNTSGFGTDEHPAMVAIYTGFRPADNRQAQYVAYSTDRGRSWTNYEANPVIDIMSTEFRDPKVFWYEPDQRWIMVVALSAARKISFYGSEDLKSWTHLSDFGPAGAIGGVWECPDLFELAIDGDPSRTKWVLQVDLGSGAVAGGSGGQYFVGDFDGTRFIPDEAISDVGEPQGVVFADFEDSTYGEWTVNGTAFGSRPAKGTLAGQQTVAGYRGQRLVNTFYGGDATTGTLTSPAFTIEHNFINLLVGGGHHPGETAVNLLVDGAVARTATGQNSEMLDWIAWDVAELRGEVARIEIVDSHTGGWGHILVDHIMFSDEAARPSMEVAEWIDFGKDFYAVQSWSDIPEEDGRRIWIAWINNWQYAEAIPTHPWRSAQSIPRVVELSEIGGEVRLVQRPIDELQHIRRGTATLSQVVAQDETISLSDRGVSGRTLELILEIDPGDASEVGINVLQSSREKTVIGYEVENQRLYVDRSESGRTDFHPTFASKHYAGHSLHDGRLKLHVFVDWSVVEVFAGSGEVVFTDRVFPSPGSNGVSFFARGGTARIVEMEAHDLGSTWSTATSVEKKSTN
jgi:sucrose-6-phosphate hydrolase SacC (GH32 family)